MVSETGIKVLIKEIQRLKEENIELQLKLGKQERDAFFKKGGKITPIRIVHLAEKTAIIDYVNNRVIFESWQGYASFSVDLNKFDYIFIPSCRELPCKLSELKNYYATTIILFISDIKEIIWHDDTEEEVVISLKNGRTLCVQNTLENIINQLKGQ